MFQAVSPFQRAFEGLFSAGLKGVTATAGASFMKMNMKGIKSRGMALSKHLLSDTKRALQENADSWSHYGQRLFGPGRSVLGRAISWGMAPILAPAKLALSAIDMGVGVAADALGAVAMAGGTVAGLGLKAVGKTVAMPIKMAGRAAFRDGGTGLKTIGNMGISTAHGATQLGIGATKQGIAGVQALGKFAWATRKDPVTGTLLAVGAVGAGLIYGSQQTSYNSSMGVINTDVSKAANQMAEVVPRGRKAKLNPQLDTLGASGDLVFALHNLRNGGVM